MNISAIEGIIQNGQIRLPDNVTLPENTKVYVVVPGNEVIPVSRISSPRLAHPEQFGDFVKQVVEENADAGI